MIVLSMLCAFWYTDNLKGLNFLARIVFIIIFYKKIKVFSRYFYRKNKKLVIVNVVCFYLLFYLEINK
jgi:hypothetical protein